MKVQIFETFECSGQNSPNSCLFWNNISFFFKFYINLQSHGSWRLLMMMNCFCGMVDRRKAEPNFQPGLLSEILTITNLRHAASRIWTCAEPVFRLRWMKLCSSDNHYTMYFFSLSFIYFQQKESIKVQSWWNFT